MNNQCFHPDDLFTQQQQTQLIKLMGYFQETLATGNRLSSIQQQELKNLVEAEARGCYFSFG